MSSRQLWRKHCADVSLDAGELDKDLLRTCHFLHFGAVSLTDEPSRTATLEAARIAKYRPALWSNEHE